MSFLSSIKAVGRMVDPTSKSAPFGSLVNSAIAGAIPGGGLALSAIGSAGKSGAKPVVPPPPAVKAPSLGEKWSATATGLPMQLIGIGLAVLLVAMLVFRKK